MKYGVFYALFEVTFSVDSLFIWVVLYLTRRFPPSDFDPVEDGVLADLDHYEPKLRTTIAMLVLGDVTVKGCYPDWARAEKILKKYTGAT
jgi:hypothetical protein